jgi:hypothetical protein
MVRALVVAVLCVVGAMAGVSKSEAATMSAVFRGTVISGSDVTGTFGSPLSDLTGEEFALTYIYDPDTPGAEFIDDLPGNAIGEWLRGGEMSGFAPPVQSAILVIKGISHAILTTYHNLLLVTNSAPPDPAASSVLYNTVDRVDSPANGASFRDSQYSASVSLSNLDIPASLSVPYFVAGLVEEGQFRILECIAGRDDRCGTRVHQVSGRLNVASLEVTQIPVPAALPLLASCLGALGIFSWRRRSHPLGRLHESHRQR